MLKKIKNLKNKNFRSFFILLLTINISLFAQEKQLTVQVEVNPINSNYWWVENNMFGMKPTDLYAKSTWEIKKSKTMYLINIIGTFSKSSSKKLYLHESFIKHDFSQKTFIRAGKYYRDFSTYLNDDLSSGSMLISHNAQAMPKVGLVTSQKIKKFNKITFDFGIASAIFDKNDHYNKSPQLHEKFIYMNYKKKNYQISFGLVHEAMWGGSTIALGDQPDTFKDFIKVFLADDGEKVAGDAHANALGNHLGIWDLSFQKQNNNQKLKLYYQHIFEDTSGIRFANKFDGLWGVEFENYIPKTTLLFEYMDTTNCCIDPPYVDDQYYDNYQYTLGWSYKNYTLGNPFISRLPFIPTKVFHVGASSQFESIDYQIKASKRIDVEDTIKYKINIIKKINARDRINIFIVNDAQDKNGMGVGISRFL